MGPSTPGPWADGDWGVLVLVWALGPQFSLIRWGDSNLLVIPLRRVIPRRGKLRPGQPPGQTPPPLVQAPPSGGDADRADGGLHVPALGRVSWGVWVRPPQVGGVPCRPPPPRGRGRRARAAWGRGGWRGRPSPAPRPALTAFRAAPRPRQRQAQGQAERRPGQHPAQRTGRSDSASPSLARSWAAPRVPALAGPGPAPKGPAPRRALGGEARARRDRAAHSWACSRTDTAAFLYGRETRGVRPAPAPSQE